METITTATPAAPAAQVPSPAALVRRREADGMAIASFVLGLIGLLLFNLVLGPIALVLGGLALRRGTARRGRALLGITLGVADVAVMSSTLIAAGGVVWQIG